MSEENSSCFEKYFKSDLTVCILLLQASFNIASEQTNVETINSRKEQTESSTEGFKPAGKDGFMVYQGSIHSLKQQVKRRHDSGEGDIILKKWSVTLRSI